MSTAGASLRALDRLKKAANLVPVKRIVILSDGAEFEFWSTPLTMAERERAQKQAGSDDATQYALQLLVNKRQMKMVSGCLKLVNWPSLKTTCATKTCKV